MLQGAQGAQGAQGDKGTLEAFTSVTDTLCGETAILEPISAATDINVVINKRGTGFISANAPDQTAVGGDCRGDYAVDWQTTRNISDRIASGLYSVIGGGFNNIAANEGVTVAGGTGGTARGNYATIGGGNGNISTGENATVSGGGSNRAGRNNSTVGGGQDNDAAGLDSTVGGGRDNTSSGQKSTISGGVNNQSNATKATVSGGENNAASRENASIGGGLGNIIEARSGTIGGGTENLINESGILATIGGGTDNNVGTHAGVIAGGESNQNFGDYAGVGNGIGNLVSFVSSYAVGQYNQNGTFSGSERVFMVGYGSSTSARTNLFSVTQNGDANIVGTYTSSGADFAEYMESIHQEKLKVGTVVMIADKTGKITPSNDSQKSIGVISNTASVLGNTAGAAWHGKYEKDVNGKIIWEEVEVEEEQPIVKKETVTKVVRKTNWNTDPPEIYSEEQEDLVEIPQYKEVEFYDRDNQKYITKKVPLTEKVTRKQSQMKVSPTYDPNNKYIPRSERPEWNIVGLTGQVKILKDQPVHPNWIKLKELNSTYDLWLIK